MGLPMVGVNLPAHFMIRPVVEEMEVLVDCFKDGEIVFVEDVEEMLKKHYTMAEGETLTIDRSFFQDSVRERSGRERESGRGRGAHVQFNSVYRPIGGGVKGYLFYEQVWMMTTTCDETKEKQT